MSSLFNINGFKNVVQGVQRSSLFTVEFDKTTSGTMVPSFFNSEKIKFVISSASVPASTVGQVKVNYMGRQLNYPGDRTETGSWNTKLILNNQWNIYAALLRWSVAINHPTDNTAESNDASALWANATVKLYSSVGEENAAFTLYDVFPLTVPEINLDWQNSSQPLDVTVQWSFNYWLPLRLGDTKFANGATGDALRNGLEAAAK